MKFVKILSGGHALNLTLTLNPGSSSGQLK